LTKYLGVEALTDKTSAQILAAGQDYPRTYREFVALFPDTDAGAVYLQRLRWPDGFVCPACSGDLPPLSPSFIWAIGNFAVIRGVHTL